jgi:hypothetical protein
VHVDRARVLLVGQSDEQVVAEAERLGDVLPDERSVVRLGERLDQDRCDPVRGAPVIVHPRARRPLERERAHRAAQQLVVLPRVLWYVGAREPALVRQELDDRDIALAVGLEPGHVIGHPIGERERAALDQDPHRARGDDLGVRVEEPERLVSRGRALGLEPRIADRPQESELAVARDGDLRGGITALGDVRRDQLAEPRQGFRIETERFDGGRGQWECHGGNSSTIAAPPPSGRGGVSRSPACPRWRPRPRDREATRGRAP